MQRQTDIREIPNYTLPEAAAFLGIPRSTLRTWIRGYSYKTLKGKQHADPVLDFSHKTTGNAAVLSFYDLVELHILSGLRRKHTVEMESIRKALGRISEGSGGNHPLLNAHLLTDGKELFIEELGNLTALSDDNQRYMKKVLEQCLERVEWDKTNSSIIRWYPYSRKAMFNQDTQHAMPKIIVIDPEISFGKPSLAGYGVKVSAIVDRFNAGDSAKTLAEDYKCPPEYIEEALRFASAA